MKFCSSPALEVTCTRGCSQVCGFRRGWPGPSVGLGQRPIWRKGRPAETYFFVTQGLSRRGPWPGASKCGSPAAPWWQVLADGRGQNRRWPRGWRGSGSPKVPPPTSSPPGPPAKARRRACRPAGDRGRQTGRVPPRRASANRLFDRDGRSASRWLEPRDTRVWQFDPVDGIVYCGARGRRVSLQGGQRGA